MSSTPNIFFSFKIVNIYMIVKETSLKCENTGLKCFSFANNKKLITSLNNYSSILFISFRNNSIKSTVYLFNSIYYTCACFSMKLKKYICSNISECFKQKAYFYVLYSPHFSTKQNSPKC